MNISILKLFKLSEFYVTAHIYAPFHIASKTNNYDVIFGRDLLRELGILLDFQNYFIGWQDINLSVKPMDCKKRTHFTIQDSINIRNENLRCQFTKKNCRK